MISIFKQFKTNESKESEGVWVYFGDEDKPDTPAFLICRSGKSNKKYIRELERATSKNKGSFRSGKIPSDIMESIALKVFCKTVILDWKNIINLDKETIPFSYENAKSLMLELPDLYDQLSIFSQDFGNFKDEEMEDESGN